jgi:selenide,water dikinase
MSAQLLLIGGGHAHLGVLQLLAKRRLKGIDVTLVSPHADLLYSGMVPGLLAGHYEVEQCSIPLDPLTDAAHADFVCSRVKALDLANKVATTEQGQPIPFDVVSIDIGPAPNLHLIPGLENSVPIRPMEQLLQVWRRLEHRFAGLPLAQTVGIIGGGAAGAELACALAQRARTADLQVKLTLVTGRAGLLPTLPRAAARLMKRRLTALGVRVIEVDAEAVGPNRLRMPAVGEFYADVILNALPAGAWRWPAEAGLKHDRLGFIEVNDGLQSLSHPFVFAAGDCATMVRHPRPRSGVYAVRAGAHLGENLLRFVTRKRLHHYAPQRRALYLVSTGEKHAIGVWGSFVFDGEWVWRWKDRIDRGFIARHNPRVPARIGT